MRRALGVSVAGLTQNGWEYWPETDLNKRPFEQAAHPQQAQFPSQQSDVSFPDDNTEALPKPKRRRLSESVSKTLEESFQTATFDVSHHAAQPNKQMDHTSLSEVPQTPFSTPSAAELKHAEALKQWASNSPHTAPPSETVHAVSRCTAVESVLRVTVPEDATSQLLGPVIRVLTESIGTSFADHVIRILVEPYMKTLSAPAPRDVMDALVAFSKRHWRATLSLYKIFMQSNSSVNGAVAEILVRISAVISIEGSLQAFQVCCKGLWGEDGVRVVESLLSRCRNSEGVTTLLVAALQRNVIGSEKSVRFGKLLFTAAKDVPGIADEHAEAMEAVCSRCKAFLAKRALSLIQNNRKDA